MPKNGMAKWMATFRRADMWSGEIEPSHLRTQSRSFLSLVAASASCRLAHVWYYTKINVGLHEQHEHKPGQARRTLPHKGLVAKRHTFVRGYRANRSTRWSVELKKSMFRQLTRISNVQGKHRIYA